MSNASTDFADYTDLKRESSMHKAFVLEGRAAEVEQQSHVETGGLEVVDNLGFFNRAGYALPWRRQ
jgi:hypothetical protein